MDVRLSEGMFSSVGLAETGTAVLVLVDQKGCSVVCGGSGDNKNPSLFPVSTFSLKTCWARLGYTVRGYPEQDPREG